jgi:hypothetical protein
MNNKTIKTTTTIKRNIRRPISASVNPAHKTGGTLHYVSNVAIGCMPKNAEKLET